MRIDLRELKPRDGFQFIGGPTVFKVIDAYTFGSTVRPSIDSMPSGFNQPLIVWSEDWMRALSLFKPEENRR